MLDFDYSDSSEVGPASGKPNRKLVNPLTSSNVKARQETSEDLD
jgi:hypothetical protein